LGLHLRPHHLTPAKTDDKLMDQKKGHFFDELTEPLGFALAETSIGGGGKDGSKEKIVSRDGALDRA
jgi:hypothetical protein